MPELRQLRLAARFARHRLSDVHPFEVQAVLLNACNLKCAYCKCPEIKIAQLSTEHWRQIVRRLGKLGTMRIKWQGGEPTLRNDFRELCAETQRAGIVCAVVTNGTAIAADPTLLDHLDEAVFSLDSVTPGPNDAVRGEGVHAQVVRAIDEARSRGVAVFINMVVSRETLAELEPMVRFCEERSIGLNAQPVIRGTMYYDEGARGIELTNEETRAMYRSLAQWKRQGRPLMFGADTYDYSAAWGDYVQVSQRSHGESACAMGRFYVHIEANGDVHPCAQHTADFQPKNIVRHGLEESLRHVRHHNCGNCYSAYLNERKAIFGLRPHAVLEFLRR